MEFKYKRVYPVYTEVTVHCDCGGEYQRYGNSILLSHPAQYPHKCNSCGKEINLLESELPGIKTKFVTKEQLKELGYATLCLP